MKIRRVIKELISAMTEGKTGVYAAQASFFLVISAIPFLILIFSLMGIVTEINPDKIVRSLSAYAPAEISRFASSVITELTDKSASVHVISATAVSALWLSSRGFSALYTGLAGIYSFPKRGYLYVRLISLVYTVAFIAALLLTIIFIGFGSRLEELLRIRSAALSGTVGLLFKCKLLFFLVYLTLIFASIYKFIPKAEIKFTAFLPGALFAAFGWIVFSLAYGMYIDNFSNYTLFYGSMAAVVLLMLWLYICMNIFLCGAHLNLIILGLYRRGGKTD